MNSTEHNTGPAAKPAPQKPSIGDVALAMRMMEGDIIELMHMSDIAANAFDDMGAVVGADEFSITYRFTKHELDQFGFLINNVASRANRLSRRFDAAHRGEVLA